MRENKFVKAWSFEKAGIRSLMVVCETCVENIWRSDESRLQAAVLLRDYGFWMFNMRLLLWSSRTSEAQILWAVESFWFLDTKAFWVFNFSWWISLCSSMTLSCHLLLGHFSGEDYEAGEPLEVCLYWNLNSGRLSGEAERELWSRPWLFKVICFEWYGGNGMQLWEMLQSGPNRKGCRWWL